MKIRELKKEDISNGFLDAIGNLSPAPTKEQAEFVFEKIKNDNAIHIFVCEDDDGSIVGTTTLVIEQKFIHDGRSVGHIEDVAVAKRAEGKGIGKLLITAAMEKAKEEGCYKIILNCVEELTHFYEKQGFRRSGEIQMRLDI